MKATIRILLAGFLPALTAAVPAAAPADPNAFPERFALSTDRDAVLQELIPGTPEYFFWHALHYQNSGRREDFERVMRQWQEAVPGALSDRDMLLNRQRLLDYDRDPQETLQWLKETLGVSFHHQRESGEPDAEVPSVLDPARVAYDVWLQQAIARHSGGLEGLTDSGLRRILRNGTPLDAKSRRQLLSRIRLPDVPGLTKLILEDLAAPDSGGFGSFAIHRALTLEQLGELLEGSPSLIQSQAFVDEWLKRLAPSAGEDPVRDPAVRDAWLTRLQEFTAKLPPSFHSLRAHVLYHRLQFDLRQGRYNREVLLEYLRLPRPVPWVPQPFRERRSLWDHPVNFSADFSALTGLPPIGSDEGLVRTLLLGILAEAPDAEEFAPWIERSWLNAVLAEAKLTAGAPDAEKWAALLAPDAWQALRTRTDVEFAPDAREQFQPEDEVSIDLFIKNVPRLLVKVFEIHTENVHRSGREVNTDLDLDGLVANEELTFEYTDPPVRRVRRTFHFPSLQRRSGVWIIEFIGGGKSSRALIRKGSLHFLTAATGGGTAVIVLDHRAQPVPGAWLQAGTQRFTAGEDGRILVPFLTTPGPQQVVIGDGSGVTALETVDLAGEDYSLRAGFHLPRQSLLPGGRTAVAIRPRLTCNGIPIGLDALRNARLVILSTSRGGVPSTRVVAPGELSENGELVVPFSVPDRTAFLGFRLEGEVTSLVTGKPVPVSAEEGMQVQGIAETAIVTDLFLRRTSDGWHLEELGRNGEPRPNRRIQLSLVHPDFTDPVNVTLRTDEKGAVRLGALAGISAVTATTESGHSRVFQLPAMRATVPPVIHAREGEPVKLVWPWEDERPDRGGLSILGIRQGAAVAAAKATIAWEDGTATVSGLAPGDYSLFVHPTLQESTLRVAAGRVTAGWAVSPSRELELANPLPLVIGDPEPREVEAENGGGKRNVITIRIANATPDTRVHVLTSRFLPEADAFEALGNAGLPAPRGRRPAWLPSFYQSARTIGEEYRYVLDRRASKHYPGNMLPRPGLILNPWAISDTETLTREAAEGEVPEAMPGGAAAAAEPASPASRRMRPEDAGAPPVQPDYSFLRHPSVALWNLRPDENGVVTFDAAAAGERTMLRVVAVSDEVASTRDFALPDAPVTLRDIRLAGPLDPERHFAVRNAASILPENAPFRIEDGQSTRLRTCRDLGEAWQILHNLSRDNEFERFEFVTRWGALEPAEKERLYSEHACHELHFFLYRKDPGFFRSVVLPFLSAKKHATFLDEWLTGRDVSGWLSLHRFGQLNTVERILLAHRIPAQRDPVIRLLSDQVALFPSDPAADAARFEGVLWGAELAAGRRSANGHGDDEAFDFGYPFAPNLGRLGILKKEADAQPGEVFDSGPGDKRTEATVEFAEKNVLRFGRGDRRRMVEQRRKRLFRQMESTREWAEHNYHKLPIAQQNAALVQPDRFWLDYARWDGSSPFLSPHLAEAAGNFTEMMLALAVLDLPFAGTTEPDREERTDGALTLTPSSRMLLFRQEIRPADPPEAESPLLVTRNFYRNDERSVEVDGARRDRFVTGEFLTGVVYGCQVVVSNSSPEELMAEVLFQVPQGAIPVLKTQPLQSSPFVLEPFHTRTFDFHFYFPAAGEFTQYPVHVTRGGSVLAFTQPFRFRVVDRLSAQDTQSWEYVSQHAEADAVLAFLDTHNVHSLDLSRIAWRLHDAAFFDSVITRLTARHCFRPDVWSYGLLHNHLPAIREWLAQQDAFLATCGPVLESTLVTIDPVERRSWQFLEYMPFVNARAHPLGGTRAILNDRLRAQYDALLNILSFRQEPDTDDRMSVLYYLALQDRIGEALEWFGKINPGDLPGRIQYDYFHAWLSFFTGDTDTARGLAGRYANHPVRHWREKFAAVAAHLAEATGAAPADARQDDRDGAQNLLAAADPQFDFRIEDRKIVLTSSNVDEVTVRYYPMDLEFLFSASPFVSQDSARFRTIRPHRIERLTIPAGSRENSFPLPGEYQHANVLVEITAGGRTRAVAAYANQLDVLVSENYGQLTVRHAVDRRPLPGVYVKVFAERNGAPAFYKDGYTDLRGKFDYASLSTDDLDSTSRFSILILSPDAGATVREAAPPAR